MMGHYRPLTKASHPPPFSTQLSSCTSLVTRSLLPARQSRHPIRLRSQSSFGAARPAQPKPSLLPPPRAIPLAMASVPSRKRRVGVVKYRAPGPFRAISITLTHTSNHRLEFSRDSYQLYTRLLAVSGDVDSGLLGDLDNMKTVRLVGFLALVPGSFGGPKPDATTDGITINPDPKADEIQGVKVIQWNNFIDPAVNAKIQERLGKQQEAEETRKKVQTESTFETPAVVRFSFGPETNSLGQTGLIVTVQISCGGISSNVRNALWTTTSLESSNQFLGQPIYVNSPQGGQVTCTASPVVLALEQALQLQAAYTHISNQTGDPEYRGIQPPDASMNHKDTNIYTGNQNGRNHVAGSGQ